MIDIEKERKAFNDWHDEVFGWRIGSLEQEWDDTRVAALMRCWLAAKRHAAESLQVKTENLAQAATDVLAERKRQCDHENWTPDHDDHEHNNGELSLAAASYALSSTALYGGYIKFIWPWGNGAWKPKSRRLDLVRAGALILAEIERLDREYARALLAGAKGE